MRGKFKYVFLLILLTAAVFTWREVFRFGSPTLKFYALDIGQGDAIFIETPSNNQILIDGGPGRSVLGELGKVMPFYDRSLDVVIASHPDADHIGGLPEVLKNYKVDLVIEPGVSSESAIYEEFRRLVKEKEIENVLARRGMKIFLDEGTYLLILFPDRDVSGLDSNDASIVAKLVHGQNSFLFTGDSPVKIERYLISLSPEELDADVLKVGHHGSRTSTSDIFAAAVSPAYAVISAGRENRYGHPHQEVLDILSGLGTRILRTDELGRIFMESTGESLILK